MSTIESIVPPLELCKKIPDGEFNDTALVWVVKCDHEECAPRTMFNAIPNSWKVYPAPTAGEIMAKLDTPSLWHRGTGRWYCMCKEHVMVEAGENTSDAALRLWLRVKGIEVK